MKKFKALMLSLMWSVLVILFPVLSGVLVSVLETEVVPTMLIQAGFMGIGLLVGILVIVLGKRTIREGYFHHSGKNVLLYLPAVLLFLPTAVMGFEWKGDGYFFAAMLLYLLVGVTEELYFRYFVVEELKRAFQPGLVVLFGTLFFGLGHAAVAFSRTDVWMTLLTIVNALLFGFMATVLVLKSRNILPLMLIHFLFDFESKFIVMEGMTLAYCEFARGGVMLLYGLTILFLYFRDVKKGKEEITA